MVARVRKTTGLKVDPDIIQLAENEIAVKFMEHPELETEVKGKISELIEHRGGRQVIESQDAIRYLRKNLGVELAAIMCSVSETDFAAFGRASKPKKPTNIQNRNIAAVYIIVDILLSQVSRQDAINWLTQYSDYLYGIPAVEIHRRPEDVRMAALNKVTGGEDTLAPIF